MPSFILRLSSLALACCAVACGAESQDHANAALEPSLDPDPSPATSGEPPGTVEPTTSPADSEPSAASAPTTGSIECSFYYRPSNEITSDTELADLEFTEEVLLVGPDEEKSANLGKLELWAAYSADKFEGDSFHLRVTAGDVWLISTLYQLPSGLPINQFSGDHGFTGLMYFTHPTDGGDYQAICKSIPD